MKNIVAGIANVDCNVIFTENVVLFTAHVISFSVSIVVNKNLKAGTKKILVTIDTNFVVF
jgi:hypothetical protein